MIWITIGVVIAIVAVCYLIMAVGLLRGKTFKSCGCASISYKGEKIDCSLCPNKKDVAPDGPHPSAE